MIRVDDKLVYGIDQSVPDHDPIFPNFGKSILKENLFYNKITRELKRYNELYSLPDHRTYVFTNVPGLDYFYTRNGMLGHVRTNYNVGDVYNSPDNKGVYIVQYYTIYNMPAMTATPYTNGESEITISEIYNYYLRHATSIKESDIKDILNVIKKITDKTNVWDKVEFRMIDFISIDFIRKHDVILLEKYNMAFSKYIAKLGDDSKNNILDDNVLINTKNKTIIEIELYTKDIGSRVIQVLDELITIDPKIDKSIEEEHIVMKTYSNGMLRDEKVLSAKEDLFKHVYKDETDLIKEEGVLNSVTAKVNKSINIVAERINAASKIKEQLLKQNMSLHKLIEAITKNEIAKLQLEKSEFKELVDVVKGLSSII